MPAAAHGERARCWVCSGRRGTRLLGRWLGVLTRQGITLEKVTIEGATPAQRMGKWGRSSDNGIALESEFATGRVDDRRRTLLRRCGCGCATASCAPAPPDWNGARTPGLREMAARGSPRA